MDSMTLTENNIFFTSDLHFSHENILKYNPVYRDTPEINSSVEKMNEKILKNINSVVGKTDILFVLGDLFLTKKVTPEHQDIFNRMNGQKILVLGNHDVISWEKYITKFNFSNVSSGLIFTCVKDGREDSFGLIHDPMRIPTSIQYSHVNKWLCGHFHDMFMYVEIGVPSDEKRILNVGMDNFELYPISLSKVKEIFDRFENEKEKISFSHWEDWDIEFVKDNIKRSRTKHTDHLIFPEMKFKIINTKEGR